MPVENRRHTRRQPGMVALCNLMGMFVNGVGGVRPDGLRRLREMANTSSQTKRRILATVHATAVGLHRAGVIDNATLRAFDALCAEDPRRYAPITGEKR